MSITTISSRTFNQNVTEAKRTALKQPVFITDRGSITHVLLNIDQFKEITRNLDNDFFHYGKHLPLDLLMRRSKR